jgi:hypothetical protein
LICLIVAVALVVALPVSISRSMLAGYLQVLVATITALLLSRGSPTRLISGVIALVLAIGIASNVPAFQDSSEAFITRWESAAAFENSDNEALGGGVGVFQTRVLKGITDPLASLDNIPLLGLGIGIGSNIGAQRIGGERVYLVGEGAWESSIGEMGVPLGLAFLAWRVGLGWSLLRKAIYAATRGNRLPLILLGSSLLIVINGQISQSTGLGFLVVSAGLTLAACNASYSKSSAKAPMRLSITQS